MKRANAAVRARVHQVWMPIIDAIFSGAQPPESVLAEARVIERQLALRDGRYPPHAACAPVSMPLFEGDRQ